MRVAAVQASPVFLDKRATLDKVLRLMEIGARRGIEVLVFPETFLPGYPVWVSRTNGAAFDDTRQKRAYRHYLEAAVEQHSPEMKQLADASRDLRVFTYLGIAERGEGNGSGTIYCSLAAFHPEHGLVGLHRKLVPTYEERLVWGIGDGHGLRVHSFKNIRFGGLNCWENWMPSARQALYAQGEEVHIAVWPGRPALTADISRFIALEGRVFVVSAGGLLTAADIPADFPLGGELLETGTVFNTGGSLVVAPDGRVVAKVAEGEEGFAVADIDIGTVLQERQNFDPAGHYSRPDVLTLRVNRKRLEAVEFGD